MICFHHNDLDGRCAGAIVKKFYDGEGRTEFREIDYKDEFPLSDVLDDEEVFIVDFSIEPEMMKRLLQRTQKVIWIDHHKTAIAKYEGFGTDISGIRCVKVSGCELTWEFFKSGTQPPPCVALIGDRDTWQWKFGDDTKYFYYGMQGMEQSVSASIWSLLLAEGALTDTSHEQIMRNGHACAKYQKNRDADLMKLAFPVTFEGHNCIALNAPRISSETFGENDYDIMLGFYRAANNWTVSLYSTTVDVAKIAVKYSGGGHTGAAGFVCKKVPFLK